MKIKTVPFVSLVALIDDPGEGEFEQAIFDALDNHHTWGDTSATLIDIGFIAQNAADVEADFPDLFAALKERIQKLIDQGVMYADLEDGISMERTTYRIAQIA